MVLVSHIILQDHVTKWWSRNMGRSPSWQVTSFASLKIIGSVVVEI